MYLTDLDQQVANATGEDVRTIRRRGFQLVSFITPFDPEPDDLETQVYDWDNRQSIPLRQVA